MIIRYYEGWTREKEVPVEVIQELAEYTKVYLEDSGNIKKIELFGSGILKRVDYLDVENPESIRISHCQNHVGVPFSIKTTLLKVRTYIWSYIYSFKASGELIGFTKSLSDEKQYPLMDIEMNRSEQVGTITKYYWEEDDELRYAFEYDENGVVYIGRDFLYGDDASLSELKDHVVDSDFYENGYNLPQAIADTEIPPNPKC